MTGLMAFAVFGLVTFLGNLRRLADPPYWDAILGVYTQGLWLAHHHFDYPLLAQQAGYLAGGPRVQLWAAWAPLFAILTRIGPPAFCFFVLHLISLFCSALTLTLVYSILRTEMPDGLALLWALAVASQPIWSGQTASIYLEIPVVAVQVLSIYYFWKERYAASATTCILSFLAKYSAPLLAAILPLIPIWEYLHGQERRTSRSLRTVGITVSPLLIMLFLKPPLNFSNLSRSWSFAFYAQRFMLVARYWFPDMVVLSFLALLFLITHVIFNKAAFSKMAQPRASLRMVMFCGLYITAFWCAFFTYPLLVCRYVTSIIPFVFCLLALCVSQYRRLAAGVVLGVIGWNLWNQQGRLLPPVPSIWGRSGDVLERSREYLKDLDGNRRLCRYMEEKQFDSIIVTKSPYTQMLTNPEFGYVHKALPHIIGADQYSSTSPAASLRSVWATLLQPGVETVCLFSPNSFEFTFTPSLEPTPQETILYADHSLPQPDLVFRRRWIAADFQKAMHEPRL